MALEEFKLDFIGIATIRGGSSWLFQCLKEHPQIVGSKTKETKFFSDENNYRKGKEYYQKTFFDTEIGEEQITGEFDPSYLHTPGTAKRIKDMFPGVKLIALLRNPSERAYSHFKWHVQKGKNLIGSFEEVIERPNNNYINVGLYHKHLQEYLSLFERDKILVLILRDSYKDPQEFIRGVYRFLGVNEDFVPPSLHAYTNRMGLSKAKLPILNRFMFKVESLSAKHRSIRVLLMPLKLLGIKRLRKQVQRWNQTKAHDTVSLTADKRNKTVLPKEYREKLFSLFKEDISRLEQFLKRDLTPWKN